MDQGYFKQGRTVITVNINDELVGPIIDLVRDLKNQGYQQGIDFDFAYCPPQWDDFTGESIPRHTVFTFYKDELASWFSLKYKQ